MYYLLMPDLDARTAFIAGMKAAGITTPFHYVPLHSSPFGRTCSRVHGEMSVTDELSDRLVRLPLYPGVGQNLDRIIETALRSAGHG